MVTDLETLPADVREHIELVAEKTGFVPNVFLALARRPEEFRAFVAYYDAVMERDGGLTRAEREMIVVATSAAWDCPYCVVSHSALLRIRSKDPLLADYVATNYRVADVTPRQRAMLDYAVKLSLRPQEVDAADTEGLLGAGFSDDDRWDIAAIVALFAMSNRLAHAHDIRPNPEFHALGR